MKPGTLPWLLRFEWRLYLRTLLTSEAKWVYVFFAGLVLVGVLALMAWLFPLRHTLGPVPSTLPSGLGLPLGLLGAFVGLMMLTSAIQQSTAVMFDRNDLDLLVASPIDSRVVFASRVLAVLLASSWGWVLLAVVLALLATALGFWPLLGLPLGLVLLGMQMTALGVGFTFLLVRLLGVQRTRLVTQTLAVLMGGVFFLLTQLPNLLNSRRNGAASQWLTSSMLWLQQAFPDQHPLWWWSRTLWLEPLPVLMQLVLSAGVLALVVYGTHRFFMLGASEARSFARKPSSNRSAGKFRSNLWWLLWSKEWRQLLRDPVLISQLLMQLVYLAPLTFMLYNSQNSPTGIPGLSLAALWMGIAVLSASTITSWLTRVMVAAEENPDLLAMAPHPAGRLRWQKFWVTLGPVWLVYLPLTVVLGAGRWQWVLLALFSLGVSTLLVAYLQTSWGQPIRRADLMKKGGQGNQVQGLVEGFTATGWACFVGAFVQGSLLWTGVGLGAGLLFPLVFWGLNRHRPSPLGY